MREHFGSKEAASVAAVVWGPFLPDATFVELVSPENPRTLRPVASSSSIKANRS
jgi:hypothetical protein